LYIYEPLPHEYTSTCDDKWRYRFLLRRHEASRHVTALKKQTLRHLTSSRQDEASQASHEEASQASYSLQKRRSLSGMRKQASQASEKEPGILKSQAAYSLCQAAARATR